MKTEWKKLETINLNYEISDTGKLRRIMPDGSVTPLVGNHTKSHGNYLFYMINGKKYYAHRLVMLAFVGECPEGFEVDHINRNSLDNAKENLRYITRTENRLRGEDVSHAKLNIEKVKAILLLSAIDGLSQKAIGNLFGVSATAVYKITKGKSWKHIGKA